MKLNDIWRNISLEIGFFTKETFESVPSSPGVYAWFYPLRITTKDPKEFIQQVNLIFNYDSINAGKPIIKSDIIRNWRKFTQLLEVDYTNGNILSFIKDWEKFTKVNESFDKLRTIIMKATIFMPPLYVGKASNLYNRCRQHLSGSLKNDFHKRYTGYAERLNIKASSVSDLLFVCIKTNEIPSENEERLELLIEDILKTLSKPIYSIL